MIHLPGVFVVGKATYRALYQYVFGGDFPPKWLKYLYKPQSGQKLPGNKDKTSAIVRHKMIHLQGVFVNGKYVYMAQYVFWGEFVVPSQRNV
jgi:hypothetical protein